MDCKKEKNLADCACTYTSCGKRGMCCDCIRNHIGSRQLPGCCFPPEVERTYDRSFEAFAKAWGL